MASLHVIPVSSANFDMHEQGCCKVGNTMSTSMAEASAATTIHFPLPKRCADIRRGGVGEHGGGKRRHSSTARRARRVEEWRRLPPPCQAQPHLPPFVCVIKCRFPSQAASHLLGNGKTMDDRPEMGLRSIVGAMACARPAGRMWLQNPPQHDN